jgi:hypothetical protein
VNFKENRHELRSLPFFYNPLSKQASTLKDWITLKCAQALLQGVPRGVNFKEKRHELRSFPFFYNPLSKQALNGLIKKAP